VKFAKSILMKARLPNQKTWLAVKWGHNVSQLVGNSNVPGQSRTQNYLTCSMGMAMDGPTVSGYSLAYPTFLDKKLIGI